MNEEKLQPAGSMRYGVDSLAAMVALHAIYTNSAILVGDLGQLLDKRGFKNPDPHIVLKELKAHGYMEELENDNWRLTEQGTKAFEEYYTSRGNPIPEPALVINIVAQQ